MSGIRADIMINLSKSITKAFPKAKIEKWVSEEGYEDIILKTEIGRVEIKFYQELGES